MSEHQRRAYEELYPRYGIEPGDGSLDFQALFADNPGARGIVVEIGFGMGEVTLEMATAFPDLNFLGIEVHKPGVGKLLSRIRERELRNLRVLRQDAVPVFENRIPSNALHGIHIFFPDPWPKKRHHKRRLLKVEHLKLFAQRLEPGGYLYAVTDWREYAEQILESSKKVTLLSNPYGGFAPRQDFRPQTSFERKGIEQGHQIFELYLTRS
jgi:tRNA (guanine-N7-)-methyltransferase